MLGEWVDFHWEVDGKLYEYSIPGGGSVTLGQIAEVLGLADSSEGVKTSETEPVNISTVRVSGKTRQFLEGVASVKFSNPSLVWVGKAAETASVGRMKADNGLDSQYSGKLTEEQIAEIDAQTVEAGDWALISIQPFTSEESLTVTMKNGDQFTVKVTDAQISTHVITADGKDFIITVTYEDDAEIPDGVKLEAEEIDPKSDAYLEYINKTKAALGVRAGVKTAETEEVSEASADDTEGNADTDNLETDEIDIEFARFFDIRIMKDGSKIEPKAPVKVSVAYANAVNIKDGDELHAVHFGEQGTELIDASVDQEMKEIVFTQGSFSVTGTVVTTNSNAWPAVGSYVLYTQVNGSYYAIKRDGSLTSVTVDAANSTVTFDDTDQPIHTNDYMWTYETQTTFVWGQGSVTYNRLLYTEGGTTYYLNPAAETGINTSNRALARNDNKVHLSGSGADYYIKLNPDNNLQIYGQGTASNGIPIYFANNFPQSVKLHFVDENGTPLEGITYNGQTIEGSTYVVTADWAQEQGTINLENFITSGYTLSNTHKSTWQDLEGSSYPHTIIGNELRWNNGNLQYRLFYTNSDKAGSHWFDVGKEPVRDDQHWKYDWDGTHVYGNPSDYTSVDDDAQQPYDYYLVYSRNPSGSGSSAFDPDMGDIPEIGHTKEKTSNYDGTYNLELGVSAEAVEKEGDEHINVVLVVDTSSSMRRDYRNDTTDYGDGAGSNPNSRIYQTRQAVTSFVTDLMKHNQTDPDAVEMELITFNMGASVYQEWTKSASTFNGKVNNMPLSSGTNWAEALKLARTEALAKKRSDGNPTYVLFLTDGAPSQYWDSSSLSGYYVSGEGCYLGARDEARAAARDGVNLYTIFSYGTSTDQNNDYLGKLTEYAYNSSSAKDSYRYYAGSGSELKQKLESILKTMEKHLGAGDVQINDGITELTTATFEHVDPESFQYTITYQDYTDENDPTVSTLHTVDIQVDPESGNDQIITIPSVEYHTWQNGVYKTVTTDEVTIKGAVFTDSPEKNVTWKLEKADGTTYILEDNWTYKVKFKIWPSQDCYDLLAALNNGFLEWGDDFVNGDRIITAEEYKDQIDDTVTPYALKTNTTANVTYKETLSKTVDDVTTYTQSDTISVDLPVVTGMPLDNTRIQLEKVWNSTLSVEDKPNAVDLYVLQDPTEATINAFNQAYETYAAAIAAAEDDAEAKAAAEAAFAPYYYYKAEMNEPGEWKATLSIAPGIYDQYGHMNTTGHTYMVMEPAIDGHYELESTPTHPMLNGLTHDESDPNTIKDMVDVYGYNLTSLDVENPESFPPTYEQENQLSRYSVANTLKAGINIRKELVDIPEALAGNLDEDEYFPIVVTLKDAEGNPVSTPSGQDGGGALGYRITHAPDRIPAGAVVTPEGATGNDVISYTINGLTYEASKTDGVITGFTARGGIVNGTLSVMIRQCDALRIVNVPMGTEYTVTEGDISEDSIFSYKEMYWEVKKSGQIFENKTDTTDEESITETIVPDAENNVTVRNSPIPGALKLTKVVTVDGEEPQEAQYSQVDGKYVFTVTSVAAAAAEEPAAGDEPGTGDTPAVPLITKYVEIEVKNGTAFAYKVADSLEGLETAQATEEQSWALVTGLPEGDYVITETEERNGLLLSDITRGDGEEDVVDFEAGSVTVHVSSADTAAAGTDAQATFTNSLFHNDGPDRIAIDLKKTFEGLEEIPGKDTFSVVLTYSVPGHAEPLHITLSKGQNETISVGGELITIRTTQEGTSLQWHITNLPDNATDFKVREEGYDDVPGYEWTGTTLNGATVEDPSQDSNQTVLCPTVTFTRVLEREINPDNDLTFKFNDQMIWLLRATGNEGVFIISVNSLSYSTRLAVANFIDTHNFPQAQWSGLKKTYYSYEDRATSTIKVHGYEIDLEKLSEPLADPKYDYQLTIRTSQSNHNYFYTLTYDQHSDTNSFMYVNQYNEIEIPLNIVKVAKDSETQLGGAEFTLRKLTNDAEKKYPVPTVNNTFDGAVVGNTIVSDAEQPVTVSGLTQGYYELTETKAPEGYILTNSEPIYFKVDDGVIYWVEWSSDQEKWVEKSSGTMVTFTAATAAEEDDPETTEVDESAAAFTVENEPGRPLPEAGGPGTRIFTILGSILVMFAGVVLWRRRRTI